MIRQNKKLKTKFARNGTFPVKFDTKTFKTLFITYGRLLAINRWTSSHQNMVSYRGIINDYAAFIPLPAHSALSWVASEWEEWKKNDPCTDKDAARITAHSADWSLRLRHRTEKFLRLIGFASCCPVSSIISAVLLLQSAPVGTDLEIEGEGGGSTINSPKCSAEWKHCAGWFSVLRAAGWLLINLARLLN